MTPPSSPLGCDDLIGAVFELGRTLCRLQLSDEELALFTAAVLLSPGAWGRGGDTAAGTGRGFRARAGES